MSKLMPGVSQSNRLRRIRDPLPRQHLESLVTGKPFRIEPQVDREFCVTCPLQTEPRVKLALPI